MGVVAWSWKQPLQSLSAVERLPAPWLVLLERDRPAPARREVHHADANSVRGYSATEFEAFFLRFERQITSYLWRMTGDEQVASELAQETFLRAWQHFDAVSHYEQPLAWLFRVATNLARQHHRRQKIPLRTAATLNEENDPASSDYSTRFAEQDLVRQTLLQLPIRQRAALILREVNGLSCAEIGELLHISRDAVKMALWRAREQFRVRYLGEGGE
jgi:RNA polymerase sigma-70 factor (ECF subfamily)